MEKTSVFENAKYIKAEKCASAFSLYDPAPRFRKEFTIRHCENARIFVQSPGFAKYYINGQDITDDLFISAVSDYDKILWYNEYEVTRLLCEGKNVISVICGNGFLNESFKSAWFYPDAPWRDAPQFCLRIEIDCETALVSDGSWKCDREGSHIIYNHLRSGEYHDMRKKSDEWMQVGFDDSHWQYAIEKNKPLTAKFRPTECQPIREIEKIAPVSVTKTENGYLVDFGVNMSGYIETRICEERGKEIIFRYAEEVDEKGFPKHNGMDAKNFYPESPFMVNKMIASGGEDIFKPLFSYHGFRYVALEGLSEMPDMSAFTAYFTHQDVARRSSFTSENEIINFIYDAGIRSTYSNMFWCLTDCPTREKLGWMNDAQASVEQTLINFDILPLYEKWFEDIKASIFPDGSLHGTIPSTDWPWGHGCGPVCDCMLYELPYKVYLYTGNTIMLTSAIDVMENYAFFLERKCLENYSFILGDWLGYKSSELTPKEFVGDFYLIKALTVTVFAQNLAGKENAVWQEKLEKHTRDFKEKYLDGSGRCNIASQCAISMMIMAGLYYDKQALCDQLIEIVESDEYKLTCGMVGIQYIYDALTECGRGDIAYRLITETSPGYRSWFENGATTLWEKWDGKDTGSHNHHMFSGVIAWFYKSLLGIAPDIKHPAFDEIELKPTFIKELGFVKGSMETVKGEIRAEWQYEGGRFIYTVDLPEGVRARFGSQELKTGRNVFYICEGSEAK
ncbi:MAG: family 78 glycoside hydrolase catalytic domain [Clostridia bacterium]|nr:family 78 glycoside hydrolase catalytic domain [Clostridia bacterium]